MNLLTVMWHLYELVECSVVHRNRFMFSGSTECSVVYRNQFIQFRFRIRHDHSIQNLKLFSAHNEIEVGRHIVQNLKFSSGYFIHRHPIYTAKDTHKPYEEILVQDTSAHTPYRHIDKHQKILLHKPS
jgi:hypothetical protein